MAAGEIAALQIQAPFNLQAFTALDARTQMPNRAARNAILTKYERMEVVLTDGPDRGTVCRLKVVPAGQTLVTWGQMNEHWDEQPPGDVLDPGGGTGGNGNPLYDVPWAEARDAVLGRNEQPPLTSGDLIRIIDRPTDGADVADPPALVQDGSVNMGVFGGYIIVLVTDPQALEFTGRRVRTNPFSNQVETETVRYELLTDRVTRVVDPRGNDVRGAEGLSVFPFFLDWITGNVIGPGSRLYFGDGNEALYAAGNPAVGSQRVRNNSLEDDAALEVLTFTSAIAYDISGNQISNGACLALDNTDDGVSPNDNINFTANQVTADVTLAARLVPLTLAACRLADVVDFSLLTPALSTFILTSATSPGSSPSPATELRFINQTLTPTESSFEVCILPIGLPTLDVTALNWAGLLLLYGDEADQLLIDHVRGLAPRRPLQLGSPSGLTSGNILQLIRLQHHPPELVGYGGATSFVNVNVPNLGRATLLRTAPDTTDEPARHYVQVVDLLNNDAADTAGGHIIFDGNTNEEADPIGARRMPQQPNLIVQGPGVAVENNADKRATVITINGGEAGPQGRGYQTTSGTANTLTAGTKTWVCDTPAARLAYQAGARVRASATADPAGKFMEGIVTATSVVADVLTLAVAVDYLSGISATAISAWNLNVAGEKPLYTEGQVDYSAGNVLLRLETGSFFEVDLNTAALGAAGTITLDYTGAASGKSVLIRIQQKAAAPFRQLAYAAGKFDTCYAYAVPLTQTANAVDQLTGIFHKRTVGGLMSLVYKPNVKPL